MTVQLRFKRSVIHQSYYLRQTLCSIRYFGKQQQHHFQSKNHTSVRQHCSFLPLHYQSQEDTTANDAVMQLKHLAGTLTTSTQTTIGPACQLTTGVPFQCPGLIQFIFNDRKAWRSTIIATGYEWELSGFLDKVYIKTGEPRRDRIVSPDACHWVQVS